MEKAIVKFDDTVIEKHKFHLYKNPIYLILIKY